VTTPSP